MTLGWLHVFLDVPRDRWEDALAFWPAATGCTLSDLRGEQGQFATLVPAEGDAWLKLQAIDDGTAGVHLDLDSTDRPAAVAASERLGATRVATYHGVAVMRSPGGLPFCHTLLDAPDPRMARNAPSIADQACLDIPPRLWDAEVAFWSALTGRTPEQSDSSEFTRLADQNPAGQARILLQRLDSDSPTVTAHLDFATTNRPADQTRHVALGAEVVEEQAWWTVLRAPSGHVYCLTERDPATGRPRADHFSAASVLSAGY